LAGIEAELKLAKQAVDNDRRSKGLRVRNEAIIGRMEQKTQRG